MFDYPFITIEGVSLLDQEHLDNIKMVSLNLQEFNNRFSTNIHLIYFVEDYIFYSIEPSDLSEFFINSLPDLLFMLHNPFNQDIDDWVEFIQWKKNEYEGYNNAQRDIFNKWYFEFAPIGIITKEIEEFIKEELIKIIV